MLVEVGWLLSELPPRSAMPRLPSSGTEGSPVPRPDRLTKGCHWPQRVTSGQQQPSVQGREKRVAGVTMGEVADNHTWTDGSILDPILLGPIAACPHKCKRVTPDCPRYVHTITHEPGLTWTSRTKSSNVSVTIPPCNTAAPPSRQQRAAAATKAAEAVAGEGGWAAAPPSRQRAAAGEGDWAVGVAVGGDSGWGAKAVAATQLSDVFAVVLHCASEGNRGGEAR